METPYRQPISPTQTRLGWIGTGIMGAPMASRLISAGYSLIIYTRTQSKALSLQSLGARIVNSPRVVAQHSDVVFTMVGNSKDVRSVVLESNGILSGLNPGGVIVDMTSSHPALARVIFSAARAKGCWSVDAPVSGADAGAREGTLAIFAGGDPDIVSWLKPLFDIMGRVTYMGEAGCGQSCKLANQITGSAVLVGLSEGLVFAERAGLDLKQFLDAVRGGAAGSKLMELFGEKMIERDFRPGGFAEYLVKDLGMALDMLEEGTEDERVTALPGAALTKQLFAGMVANGDAKLGLQGLITVIERINGKFTGTKLPAKIKKMVSQTDSATRESVIVVMDANRNKGMVDVVDWALKHVVRPKDTVIVVGVLADIRKKNSSCFPINMGINIYGILEKLEFSSGHPEAKPRELGEEIERKREQCQANLQPFYRRCKRNEVKLEVKLAAGLCPNEITLKEAENSNTRWIVLDSHLKEHKLYIYWHVGCNVAVMKGKDVATLMLSRASKPDSSPASCETADDETCPDNQPLNDQKNGDQNPVEEGESSIPPPPKGPCWYPLQWRAGFPRHFSLSEIEVITNGFADTIYGKEYYEGVLQNTHVIVKSFEDDERFWSMLAILLRLRHRNVMNIVGYCCTRTNRLLIHDYPSLGNIEMNLQCVTSASNLSWTTRWYTAIEIGCSLRYLHEECPDGPIVHQSVCSTNIFYAHGYSAMLGNFITAKSLKDVPCNGKSTVK
ncbi:Kinase protein with adenine nucleotide alpha hydrolases-like domain, putative isoform 2 [Theobroma cacao]|nr:Kinase protein with adenine nucleotide alpha hydrolases-like domain, putative isoform 2 [Theobroma cacao]